MGGWQNSSERLLLVASAIGESYANASEKLNVGRSCHLLASVVSCYSTAYDAVVPSTLITHCTYVADPSGATLLAMGTDGGHRKGSSPIILLVTHSTNLTHSLSFTYSPVGRTWRSGLLWNGRSSRTNEHWHGAHGSVWA